MFSSTSAPVVGDAPFQCMGCGASLWGSGAHDCVGHPPYTTPATIVTTSGTGFAWNGATCGVCNGRWVGSHDCPGSEVDRLRARVAKLERKLAKLKKK